MAKRFEHQMVQITAFDNLWAASRKAAKGKRSQPEVAAFENDLMPNLVALQEALQSGEWRPGVYRSFHIHEPKHRLISAASYADRVANTTKFQNAMFEFHGLCRASAFRFRIIPV